MSFLSKKLSENLSTMEPQMAGGSNLDKDLELYKQRAKEFIVSYTSKYQDGQEMVVPNPKGFWCCQVRNVS